MNINTAKLKELLKESHRRQFDGEDYQAVAIDLCDGTTIEWEDDDYLALQSAPDPGCKCGFCATAEWQD